MIEQRSSEVSEQAIQNIEGNKYQLVLSSSEEAKKMKQQDKNNSASLGKISIEAMNKVLIKSNKKKEKEEVETEQKEEKE